MRAGRTVSRRPTTKLAACRQRRANLAGALKSYSDSLAIIERLSDPRNAGWQRDLAESYQKIGEVRQAQGDLGGAEILSG
jgi:predicted Zn-dependent protease